MNRKQLGALFTAAALVIGTAGCLSNKTAPPAANHTLKVVDALTKLPVAGAEVRLSAPGMTMTHRTDERGMIDVGALAFCSRPRPEEAEVSMQGYNRVSFRLTNGLPPTVEITPVQIPK